MSAQLTPTPGQTIGPFFHDALPFQGGALLVAPGTPGAVRLEGLVLDGDGAPIPDALVEIRQADAAGDVPAVEGSWYRERGFTGWGRAATDASGRYSFSTLEPGPGAAGDAPFFAVCVFARGLLDRLFTRAYLPGPAADADPFLASLGAERDRLLIARDGDVLRFDIRLQGERETPFLAFPRHGA